MKFKIESTPKNGLLVNSQSIIILRNQQKSIKAIKRGALIPLLCNYTCDYFILMVLNESGLSVKV